jgi:heme exporter protein C
VSSEVAQRAPTEQRGVHWEHLVGLLGLVLLIVGQYMGLFVAPPERMMGEVGRILYTHVPAAWLSMVAFTIAFVAAAAHLFTGRRALDWTTEAAVEVGAGLNVLLLVQGSIFAKPTWGVWWTWDPRLTSSAIMLLTFVGVLMLRGAVNDADRRATWTSVATVLAYVNIPVTYFSVKWWRSLHQIQSSPDTVADPMVFILRLNAFAFLFIVIWFIVRRWRLARTLALAEEAPPLPAPEAT